MYAILGSGRTATHFRFYLSQLGLETRQWSRSLETTPGNELLQTIKEATQILVLVKDSAIESLIQAGHEQLKKSGMEPSRKTWVHFSGSLETPLATSAHPLMSFSKGRLYSLDVYQQTAFILNQGAPELSKLLPGLPNPSYRVDPKKRALYHALCVMGGNFTTLLWTKVLKDFEEKLMIPGRALTPYLQTTVQNLIFNSRQALTGPLARNDQETIAKNIAALEGDAYQLVYRAFLEAYTKENLK